MGKIRVLIVANLLIVVIVIVYTFLKFIGTPDFERETKNLLAHSLLALPAVLFWFSEFRYINSRVLLFYSMYVFLLWALYVYSWLLSTDFMSSGTLFTAVVLPINAIVCLVILVNFYSKRRLI